MDGGLGQTILILGIMVAVLLSAYYVTKFLAKRGKRLTQSKHIKVIDQIFLASDKQIALIRVNGKNILVGITNQSITLLTEMDEQENIAQDADADETHGRVGDFARKFHDFVTKAKNSPYELNEMRKNARKSDIDSNKESEDGNGK